MIIRNLPYLKTLISGSSKMISLGVLSQLIIVVVTLSLTEFLDPKAFGIFGVYAAFWSILTTAMTGKYELSLLELSGPHERHKIVQLCILVLMGTSLFGLLVVMLGVFIYGLPSYWVFILISGVFSSLLGLFKMVQASDRTFSSYQATLIIGAAVFSLVACIIVFRFEDYYELTLVIAHCSGLLASLIIVSFLNRSVFVGFWGEMISFEEARVLAVRYKNFPLQALPSELIMLMPQSIVIFVNSFLGTVIAGFYTLCQRVILTPFIAFGLGFSEFIRADISVKRRSGSDVKPELYLYILMVVGTGLLVILASHFFIPILIQEFLPSGYAPLVGYLKILSFGLAAQASILFTAHLWQISDNKRLGLILLSLSQALPISIFVASAYQLSNTADEILSRLSLSMLLLSILPIFYLKNAFK